MPSHINHPELLAAVREGDEARVAAAILELPTGWLDQHGDGLITLAQRHRQFPMMSRIRKLRDADAASNAAAAKLGSEFQQELAQARADNLARAATTSFLRVPVLDAHRHSGLTAEVAGPRPHAYDPLRKFMAEDGASTGRSGRSSARSSRDGDDGSDRSDRSGRSSRRRKGHRRNKRMNDGESKDGEGGNMDESQNTDGLTDVDGLADDISEAEVLSELDEMLDFADAEGAREPTPRALELKDLSVSQLRTLIESLGGKALIPEVVVEKGELTRLAVRQLADAPLPLIDEVFGQLGLNGFRPVATHETGMLLQRGERRQIELGELSEVQLRTLIVKLGGGSADGAHLEASAHELVAIARMALAQAQLSATARS